MGWTHAGDLCHVPVTLVGAACTALVDTGSAATLLRPDLIPAGSQLKPTMVKLRTVTGELASMLGRGVVVTQVGGLAVNFRVWVAAVQDPCILGLDFLRSARGVLDLGRNTLAFPGGPTVEMVHPAQAMKPHLPTLRAAEVHRESNSPLRASPPAPVACGGCWCNLRTFLH